MSWDQFWAAFLTAFEATRVISTLVGGFLFGFLAFGASATQYSVGYLAATGYARATAGWCFLVGGVFYVPPLLNVVVDTVFHGHPDPLWPRFLGAYLLWALLCLTLGAGIWLRLRVGRRAV